MSNDAIKLPSSITIEQVEALHKVLREPDYSQRLKLDASDVQSIDTAGAQLLLAANQRLSTHGGAIEWLNCPEVMVEALTQIGLADIVLG